MDLRLFCSKCQCSSSGPRLRPLGGNPAACPGGLICPRSQPFGGAHRCLQEEDGPLSVAFEAPPALPPAPSTLPALSPVTSRLDLCGPLTPTARVARGALPSRRTATPGWPLGLLPSVPHLTAHTRVLPAPVPTPTWPTTLLGHLVEGASPEPLPTGQRKVPSVRPLSPAQPRPLGCGPGPV